MFWCLNVTWIKRYGKVPVAMTIAGSDSGGGAGIEADLKTFATVGVHGTVALTAITAQNSTGVYAVHPIPPEHVYKQIEVVVKDMGVDAAKTGMLFDSDIVKIVAKAIDDFNLKVVVDPVMIAKSGAPLLVEEAMTTLIDEIISRALVVTPNRFEAEKISGIKISNLADAEIAAKEISKLGAEAIVIKGGHIEDTESTDVLYYNGRIWKFSLPRLESKNTHGTGCSFSAAIAGYIALGYDIIESVKRAKELVYNAIKYGLPVGKGVGSVNPLAVLYRESERYSVLEELWSAFKRLKELRGVEKLVPECRSNFVYALPDADNVGDVAGFPGRITVVNGELYTASYPRFGGSSHVARIVLTAMKYDPTTRSAMNIRYSRELVNKAKSSGLRVASFDRSLEPKEIREVEGRSLSWGVSFAIENSKAIPDIIYDEGGMCKEPMIRILGKTPNDVVNKISKLLEVI